MRLGLPPGATEAACAAREARPSCRSSASHPGGPPRVHLPQSVWCSSADRGPRHTAGWRRVFVSMSVLQSLFSCQIPILHAVHSFEIAMDPHNSDGAVYVSIFTLLHVDVRFSMDEQDFCQLIAMPQAAPCADQDIVCNCGKPCLNCKLYTCSMALLTVANVFVYFLHSSESSVCCL